MAKQINTRIQLKYDSYENWKSANTTLLAGEIAIVELPSVVTGTETGVQNPPTVLFKVGPGNFNDLDWCSAKAADVYSWAKKTEADFITWVNTVVEHPAAPDLTSYLIQSDIATGGANGTIAVRGTDVAVKGLGSAAYTDSTAYATAAQGTTADTIAATIANYGDIVTHDASEFASSDIDTGVHSVELTGGTDNGTLKLTVDGATTDNIAVTGLGSAAYTNSADYATSAENGAKAAAEAAQKAIDDYAAAHAEDLQAAKDYADANDANATYSISYDSDNKKIQLVGANGGETTEIDATAFIKDGMVSNVEIVEGDLVITFNTDAGKDAINVPLVSLVDVYTGVDGTTIKVDVSSDNKVGAEIKTGAIKDGHIATDAAIAASKIAGLATVATSGSYDDLSGLPTLGALAGKDSLTAAEVGAATASDITNAIEALDVTVAGAGAGKTLATLTEADGKIAATFQDISITESQISDFGTYAVNSTAVQNGDLNLVYDSINIRSTSPVVPVGVSISSELELQLLSEWAIIAHGPATKVEIDGSSIGVRINSVPVATVESTVAKATADADGNVISETYATKTEIPTTTDDIEGGTETWIFNCGTASTVI